MPDCAELSHPNAVTDLPPDAKAFIPHLCPFIVSEYLRWPVVPKTGIHDKWMQIKISITIFALILAKIIWVQSYVMSWICQWKDIYQAGVKIQNRCQTSEPLSISRGLLRWSKAAPIVIGKPQTPHFFFYGTFVAKLKTLWCKSLTYVWKSKFWYFMFSADASLNNQFVALPQFLRNSRLVKTIS